MSLPKKDNPYTILSSDEIPCRRHLNFFKERVKINDVERDYSYPQFSDSVCVLAINDKDEVVLVGQWRRPIKKYVWEIPAGMKESGEDPFVAAKRELEEEAGVTAKEWELLGEYDMEGSVIVRKRFIYLAKDLTLTEQNMEDDESIEILWIPFGELRELIEKGEVQDAATVLAIFKILAK